MSTYKYCPVCSKKLKKFKEHKNEPARLKCPYCSFVHYNNPAPTTSALIIKDKKLLFSQRNINPKKNYWDLPGGFIEYNEHPKKAIKREMKEELNIKINKIKYFGIYTDKYLGHKTTFSTLNIYYIIKYTGRLKPKSDVKAIKWFPIKKPPKKIAFNHIKEILKDLKKL